MIAPKSRKDHTALFIDKPISYDNSKERRRQSCWRYWNRLSSLQRSIVCMILIFGTLSAVYILPTIYHDYQMMERIDGLSREKRVEMIQKPVGPGGGSHEFAQQAIKDIKKKAEDQLKERNSKTNIKRGPPGLNNLKGTNGGKHQIEQPPGEVQEPLNERPNGGHIQIPPGVGDNFDGPRNKRQEAVLGAFKHSWNAYRKYAWGHDELKPVSKSYSEWFGVGLTLIDSLDTMYIMGLTEEFEEAKKWVSEDLNLNVNKDANLFEFTIRVLGGLLSTYHLSGEKVFLDKAIDVGDRLMAAFSSGSPVPYSDVNLKSRTAHAPRWGPDSSTSEVTTIQLEFTDLSRVTGDKKYEWAVDNVTAHIHKQPKKDGLVPIFINAQTGKFRSTATITLGARGDSYYEYLFKMWMQEGRNNDLVLKDYMDAVEGMKNHLMRESEPNKLLYFGELLNGRSFSPKMDHLVCYLGGVLALGAHNGLPADHLTLGKRLTETCVQMYFKMPTGLSPEIVYFNTLPTAKDDIIVKPADSHNLQRPETIESLFYLYRITGDKKYQDWGWRIFQGFENYTRLNEGYTSISNVKNAISPGYRNKMESFWLGETLKYLYLLFNDEKDLISLDKYVFNTEAHPLPIYNS